MLLSLEFCVEASDELSGALSVLFEELTELTASTDTNIWSNVSNVTGAAVTPDTHEYVLDILSEFERGSERVMLLNIVELVGDLHFPVPRNDSLLVIVPVNGVDESGRRVCLRTFSIKTN